MLQKQRNILFLMFLFLYLGVVNSYANHSYKTSVVEKILPAVVEVISEKEIDQLDSSPNNQPQNKGGFQFRNQPNQNQRPPLNRRNDPKNEATHLGSGFVISSEGYIITNAHVISNCIQDCAKITVVFANEDSHDARLINYDEDSDIALLKITDTNKVFHYVTWGDKPELGEDVIAIGSPMNQSFTVTAGIVSSLDRFVPNAASFVPFIQTDTAINPGNSGGPLFNTRGELVGINTLIITGSGGATAGSIGLGFAIDGTYAQTVIEKLYLGHKIERPYLGIIYRPLERNDMEKYRHGFGAYIQEVVKDSPIFGILKVGDIILKIDGQDVKWRMLASIVKMKSIGDVVQLEILRQRMSVPIEITLQGKE